jgi:hypothetical protein
MKKPKTYENNGITTVIEYRWVGYGKDAQSVYQKIVTTYTIAEGIIIDHLPQPVKVFYR